MDAVDYSKQLDRKQKIFDKSVREIKQSAEDRVKDVKTTADNKVADRRAVYDREKQKLENIYKDRVDEMNVSQKQALQEKNRAVEEQINQVKEEHSKAQRDNIKKWRTELTDKSNEFKRVNKSQRELDQKLRSQLQENADTRVRNISKSSESKVEEYKKNAIGTSQDVQDRLGQEKKDLIISNNQKMNELQNEHTLKTNQLKNKITKTLADVRKEREEERIKNNQRVENNFKKVKTDSDRKIANLRDASDQAMGRVVKEQQTEIKKQDQEFGEKFVQQEKANAKEMRRLENQYRLDGSGEGSLFKKMQKKQGEEYKKVTAEKLDRLTNERIKTVNEYDDRIKMMQENFNENYQNQKIEAANLRDTEKADLTEQNINRRISDRNKYGKAIDDQRVELANQRNSSEQQLEAAREDGNSRAEKLKNEFDNNIKKVVESSQKGLKQTKNEMNAEKRILAQRLHHANAVQTKSIRAKYQNENEILKNKYEDQLRNLRNQNSELKKKMELGIARAIEESTAEMDRQRRELMQATEAEKASVRKAAMKKENELKQTINDLKLKFSKQLAENRVESENKTRKITFDLKLEKQQEAKRYQDIIDSNNKLYQRELMKMQLADEAEKERMVAQYENRIKSLQDAMRKKSEEFKNFNEMRKFQPTA